MSPENFDLIVTYQEWDEEVGRIAVATTVKHTKTVKWHLQGLLLSK